MKAKKGFGAPVEDWLKGPLADWMMDSLSSEQIKKTNVFQARGINGMISDFQTKRSARSIYLEYFNVTKLDDCKQSCRIIISVIL